MSAPFPDSEIPRRFLTNRLFHRHIIRRFLPFSPSLFAAFSKREAAGGEVLLTFFLQITLTTITKFQFEYKLPPSSSSDVLYLLAFPP